MVSGTRPLFFPAVEAWLAAESAVQSAVLFGSTARVPVEAAAADGWSDFDLHIVTTNAAGLERTDWPRALPGWEFSLQVVRPATGGVRKATALFDAGQLDLILVPAAAMRLARLAMRCGLHHRIGFLRVALNEMSTSLSTGYRFLKGERKWGAFYTRVAAEMPGVRLSDLEVREFANIFLCDLLWVLQKLERGELAAAQRVLHRSLSETNFCLARELRLRRGLSLPSFGLGRRVESMHPHPPAELAWVQVSARLDRTELVVATWRTLDGLKGLMRELVPIWNVPAPMHALLARYVPTPAT